MLKSARSKVLKWKLTPKVNGNNKAEQQNSGPATETIDDSSVVMNSHTA